VKRYLKDQDISESVNVRGDLTSGHLWFTVSPREPRPRWFTSIFVERLPAPAELDAVRAQHFNPPPFSVQVVCLEVHAAVDEQGRQARVAAYLEQLADSERLYLSSDADHTAVTYRRLYLALRHTNAIVAD
jgi:hypothetical protein